MTRTTEGSYSDTTDVGGQILNSRSYYRSREHEHFQANINEGHPDERIQSHGKKSNYNHEDQVANNNDLGQTARKGLQHRPGRPGFRYGQCPGKIKWENGKMYWQEIKPDEESEELWQLAVYHKDLRDELIALASAKGHYDYEHRRGLAENDVTSFHPDQKTWLIEDRQLRPKILFRFERLELEDPTYVVPDWYHNGKIVLEFPSNRPIRQFRNIPDTCSSELEGGIMEAIKRADSRIEHSDFLARMLPEILIAKNGKERWVPCYKTNALSARMRRFRQKAGCIVWEPRVGSDKIREFLLILLSQECKDANSTENFRDLYPHEIKELMLLNAGAFPSRGNNRAVDESTRAIRQEKAKISFKKSKNAFEAGNKTEQHKSRKRKQRITFGEDMEDGDEEVRSAGLASDTQSGVATRRSKPSALSPAAVDSERPVTAFYASTPMRRSSTTSVIREVPAAVFQRQTRSSGNLQARKFYELDSDDEDRLDSSNIYAEEQNDLEYGHSTIKKGRSRGKIVNNEIATTESDVDDVVHVASKRRKLGCRQSLRKTAAQLAQKEADNVLARELSVEVPALVDTGEEAYDNTTYEHQNGATSLNLPHDSADDSSDTDDSSYEHVDDEFITPDCSRFIARTWDEVQAISEAMQPTRNQFLALTGQSAPANIWDSYLSQWGLLQIQFHEIWTQRNGFENLPLLVALGPWTGGILNWRSARRINKTG